MHAPGGLLILLVVGGALLGGCADDDGGAADDSAATTADGATTTTTAGTPDGAPALCATLEEVDQANRSGAALAEAAVTDWEATREELVEATERLAELYVQAEREAPVDLRDALERLEGVADQQAAAAATASNAEAFLDDLDAGDGPAIDEAAGQIGAYAAETCGVALCVG